MRKRFFTSSSGSSAVEFAIIALPFFGLVLVILEVAMSSMRQHILDDTSFKLSRCASLIGLDVDRDDLLSDQICPANLPFLACDQISVGAANLSDGANVRNDSRISSWNVGSADDIIVLELSYPYEPIIPFLKIVPTISEGEDEYTYSRNLIRNEPNRLSRSGGAC